jgi:hypothetical protein
MYSVGSDRIDYGYKSSFSLNHYVQSIGLRIEFWKDRRILEIIQKSGGPESNAGGRILRRDCRS